jgi:hypothetical protein
MQLVMLYFGAFFVMEKRTLHHETLVFILFGENDGLYLKRYLRNVILFVVKRLFMAII